MHDLSIIRTFTPVIGGPHRFAAFGVINLQCQGQDRIYIDIPYFFFHFRYSTIDDELNIKPAAKHPELLNTGKLIGENTQFLINVLNISFRGDFDTGKAAQLCSKNPLHDQIALLKATAVDKGEESNFTDALLFIDIFFFEQRFC
ncbi:MAG: hypothetical protein C4531_13165 [Desulfurivibrio sp.]|nr:MAG: hypothetical protein C4531_13165 [Desulfurivibrio sp.]